MKEPADRAVLLLQKVSELLLESRAIVKELEVVPDGESSADTADRIAYGVLVAALEEGRSSPSWSPGGSALSGAQPRGRWQSPAALAVRRAAPTGAKVSYAPQRWRLACANSSSPRGRERSAPDPGPQHGASLA